MSDMPTYYVRPAHGFSGYGVFRVGEPEPLRRFYDERSQARAWKKADAMRNRLNRGGPHAERLRRKAAA